jgi:predicted nucleotidyltransferase
MSLATPTTRALRELLDAHRSELEVVFAKYGAANPRIFGSVARGEATPSSDIDIMVDLLPDHPHSELIRIAGLNVELRELLGREVDVFAPELMKKHASASAILDAVPL